MLDLLVIQPTPFCNINCTYCYLPDRLNPKRISIQTIEKTINRLFDDNLLSDSLTVVFHAGEPFVPGVAFYKDIFTLFDTRFSNKKTKIRYAMQTNGTLITDEWCAFIKEHNISIGVSIDGPRFIQDASRKTRSGKGTFDTVMTGIALLQKHNIPYHGIAVVTAQSLGHAADIFSFFCENGFYSLGLNIEEAEGVNESSSVFHDDLYESVKAFYSKVFDLYLASDRHMSVREFDHCMNAILREPEVLDITELKIHSHQTVPFGILSIDYNGNFSTYSPELIGQKNTEYNNFIFGNVRESSFLKPEKKKLLKRMNKEISAGIKRCKKECGYFSVCGGGAPANKFYENKTFESTETKYCRYHIQIPTDITLSYLENNLKINDALNLD